MILSPAAMLSADILRSRASASMLCGSQHTGYGNFHAPQLEGNSMVFMMQVGGSPLFPRRNESYTSRHLYCMPLKSSSKDAIMTHWRTSMGSIHHLKVVECAMYVPRRTPNLILCKAQDSQKSDWEREEARWLREEKRWVREEERWLREEARWATERKDLMMKIAAYKEQIEVLKMEITGLESQVKEERSKDGTLSDLISSLTSLLQSLNMATSLESDSRSSIYQAQISSSSSPIKEFGTAVGSSIGTSINIVEVGTNASQPSVVELKARSAVPWSSSDRIKTLKRGAEGADVRVLQEALAKKGFYSGDDDMEYSIFSTGTDRAVRSWQATLGESEDGIVTTELLKKLLSEEPLINSGKNPSLSTSTPEEKVAPSSVKIVMPLSGSGLPDENLKSSELGVRASVNSASGEASAPTLKKDVNASGETSRPRVYLLGENRWEEPDRLASKNMNSVASRELGEQCFSCKGQGRTMCTECEGTGELNVEEQFLEWAEEGAKCPYCEGNGVIDCDVCAGSGSTPTVRA